MPVLREWRAEIRRALKDEYVQYVKATGLASYLRTPETWVLRLQFETWTRSVRRS